MLVGYNTNVPYKGKLYHVQTEDSGLKNPVITTLLYFEGSILASKKINYGHFAGSPDYKDKVRQLMKEQHKAMIKELILGTHTGQSPQPLEEKDQPPQAAGAGTPKKEQISKSLDDVLLEYIIKKKPRTQEEK